MDGPDLGAFIWTVLGVLAAVLLPILVAAVRKTFPKSLVDGGVPPWVKAYALLFVFSVVAATISLAAWYSAQPGPDPEIKWYTAFLIGFGWEAAIEKLINPPAGS